MGKSLSDCYVVSNAANHSLRAGAEEINRLMEKSSVGEKGGFPNLLHWPDEPDNTASQHANRPGCQLTWVTIFSGGAAAAALRAA
jgi:hypothetical protein